MHNLSPDLMPRTRQILLPFVGTLDEREALLTEAFYLQDPLLYRIKRDGTPKNFCVMCVKTLLDYGCLPDGAHALARLLMTVRYDCGADKHAEIDALIDMLNALCGALPPAPTDPPPPPKPITTPPQTLATPRAERLPSVFISYSHKDTAFAQQLIADLNAAGHACWIDTSEIKGGDEWIMTIAEGILNSYAFVPIVSQSALESRWVQDEILWARQKQKRIIPVILENVLEETRFFPLVSYQGVTLFDAPYPHALPKLLSYLPLPPSASQPIIGRQSLGAPPSATPAERRQAELAYLERLQLEELLNTEKYTHMGGVAQLQPQAEMRPVFELLPMQPTDAEAPTETRRFENAVQELRQIRRCVLLGEPGGGKTTTLWKLAADLVTDALADRAAPIPLLIRLGKWTDAQQTLAAFLSEQLGDLAAHLSTLLQEGRAALLLDGLNEIPASQRGAKYFAVQAFLQQHPHLLAVVSCRALDYTVDLGFHKVNITPLDPPRIREFAQRYLGEQRGDALFWHLAGELTTEYYRRLMDYFAKDVLPPQEVERIFWLSDSIPAALNPPPHQNRKRPPNIWVHWLHERNKPSNLMILARNPYMLLMMTSIYADEDALPANRGQLFAQFVNTLLQRERVSPSDAATLLRKLAKLAAEMQTQRQQSDDTEGLDSGVVSVPRATLTRFLSEQDLYLAHSANLLEVGVVGRFTHQLLQEYFAARELQRRIFTQDTHKLLKKPPLEATEIWNPERWWERTNWEETVILLAGLYSDDPTPIITWLMHAQPEVTAQCITRSGAKPPPDKILLELREAWLPRLTDEQAEPHPRARAAIGRALGLLSLSNGEPLDNRKGVSNQQLVGHNNKPYLVPDIDWVSIPEGEFIYGDDRDGYPDWLKPAPTQRLFLPAFEISRYPITHAQFQAFIDDPDGFYRQHWWAGFRMPSRHNRAPSEQAFKFWNHPRECVSWYDAMAFCRWLSWRLDTLNPNAPTHRATSYDPMNPATWRVRLPTEFEWERAARGTQGWRYPYGDTFDSANGNTSESGIRQTSAVGIFPSGASVEGVLDMSGNVWNRCLSTYQNPAPSAAQEDISLAARRVLRGGSWYYEGAHAQAAVRNDFNANDRFYGTGFRVCRAL